MKQLFFSLSLLLAFSATKAQEPVQSAKEILSEAYSLAAKENKKVFIMFHASWCGWCHRMDFVRRVSRDSIRFRSMWIQ